LGIRTSLHKLRHYSATKLIAARVDVRTVAGRLGHGGGGTTTLRVYAAWVSESDQRAVTSLFFRMPARPREPVAPTPRADRSPYPYEEIAASLRSEIESGRFVVGSFLPGVKALAAGRGVAVGTAHRALTLLTESGHAEVVPGRGFRVLELSVQAVCHRPPHLRSMFPADMSGQMQKMTDTLLGAITQIATTDTAKLEVALHRLGSDHRTRYGVESEHYAYIGHALTRAVRELAGPVYTGSLSSSWIAVTSGSPRT